MSAEKCPECGYYSRLPTEENPWPRHARICSRLTLEDAKRHLRNDEKQATQQMERIHKRQFSAKLWEGKFHALRLENNALRRRNRVLDAALTALNVMKEAKAVLPPKETNP